ncbi:Hsp20/alpha crystallin family protein [Verrucomicrobia bacterium]|nr:Hsp20/alpha crystallin family protein [Verrucomicrobiota bacterium]
MSNYTYYQGQVYNTDGMSLRASELPYEWNEKDNSLSLELDIPGFSKDEVQVSSKLGVVSINGSPKKDSKREKFKLSFKMPSVAEETLAKAELVNGVLKVVIPKKETATLKQIPIKIS